MELEAIPDEDFKLLTPFPPAFSIYSLPLNDLRQGSRLLPLSKMRLKVEAL